MDAQLVMRALQRIVKNCVRKKKKYKEKKEKERKANIAREELKMNDDVFFW